MITLVGKVLKTSTPKTVVVEVEGFSIHPKYKKRLTRNSKYLVHDEIGLKQGDVIKFAEVRPLSKMKKWKAIERV